MVKRRIGIVVSLICFCLCLAPFYVSATNTADASNPISVNKDCSLTVLYHCEGETFSNLSVKLYKIADVSAECQYTLTSDFANSGLNINGICSVGEWNVIRSTMETHITAYNINTCAATSTDKNGEACFEALETGLYLAIAESAVKNDYIYSFESALVSLPDLDTDGRWQYDVVVTPKSEIIPPTDPDDEIEFKILKLWKDDGNDNRPKSVESEIFCNGESYKTVTLSEENNWSYRWSAKKDGSIWKVTERNIPSGYVLTTEKREHTFILTNTLIPEDPEELPPTGDTSNALLYIIIMLMSGFALIVLGLTGKRKSL